MTVYHKPSASPTTRLLDAIASERWDVAGAVAELTDNALGPERGDAHNVWVGYGRATQTLSVRDDGRGMASPTELLQLGEGLVSRAGDIGRYGVGGSRAGVWLGYAITIETFRRDTHLYHRVRADWRQMIDMQSWDAFEDEGPQVTPPADAHPGLVEAGRGTVVTLRLRLERCRFKLDAVARRLSEFYAPGIRSGRAIWVNGVPLSAPTVPEDALQFTVVVDTAQGQLWARGAAWIEPSAGVDRSGVSIGYGHRVVLPFCRAMFAHTFSGQGVCGVLDLGNGWERYLTTVKDGIRDDAVYMQLMDRLGAAIEPLARERQRSRETVAVKGIKLAVGEDIAAALDGVVNVGGKRVVTRRPPVLHPHGPHQTRGNPDPGIVSKRLPTESGRALVPGPSGIPVEPVPHKSMGGKVCGVNLDVRLGGMSFHVDESSDVWLAAKSGSEHGRLALTALCLDTLACKMASLDDDLLKGLLADRRDYQLVDIAPIARVPLLQGMLHRHMMRAAHTRATGAGSLADA